MATKRIFYGVDIDWKALPKHTLTLDNLPDEISTLSFSRQKNSHHGIGRFRKLRLLVATCVNQDCLDEIASLVNLRTLVIEKAFTATDLTPLRQCRSLRRLILKDGTKVPSLDWVEGLPPLKSFLIENFKMIRDISPLSTLRTVHAIGVEGNMWTTQSVVSFAPLTKLTQLQAVFVANCRPKRDGLKPFHSLRSLKYLQAARFHPDTDFLALRSALPQLRCQWLEWIDRYGSTRAGMKAIFG